jgi:potassium-transporting ATPase KdpC subunit
MKQHLLPAIRLTLVCLVFFCGVYVLLILVIAKAAPNQGEGETISSQARTVGYVLEGQNFNKDQYFWSRPSAVGYSGTGSGGSNKGPTNPDYFKDIQTKIDSFLAHNPTIPRSQIPSELVTASGSGLDPDLSIQGAYVQIPRIAKARNLTEDRVKNLVDQWVEQPYLGLFGTEKVNVLRLNIALNEMK